MILSILVHLLFDFPAGWYVFFLGGSFLLLGLVLLIIIFEALVLYWFDFGSFRWCLGAALLMNTFSSVLGLVAAAFVEWSEANTPGYYADMDEIATWFFFADSPQWPGLIPATMIWLLIAWGISVVSEGVLLMVLRQGQPVSRIWLLTLVANGVSYVLLLSPYTWTILAPDSIPDIVAIGTFLVVASFQFFVIVVYSWPLLIVALLGGLFVWWQKRRARV